MFDGNRNWANLAHRPEIGSHQHHNNPLASLPTLTVAHSITAFIIPNLIALFYFCGDITQVLGNTHFESPTCVEMHSLIPNVRCLTNTPKVSELMKHKKLSP